MKKKVSLVTTRAEFLEVGDVYQPASKTQYYRLVTGIQVYPEEGTVVISTGTSRRTVGMLDTVKMQVVKEC